MNNQTPHHKQEASLPKAIKILGITLTLINTLALGILGLIWLVAIFQTSLGLGLVLLFTTLGFFLCFPGAMLSFYSLSWYESLNHIDNKFEILIKSMGFFIAAIAGSWILQFIAALVIKLVVGLTT